MTQEVKQTAILMMQAKIAAQSTEMLKDMASQLMSRFEAGAAVVFNYVLNELETRMTETEFSEFCDNL